MARHPDLGFQVLDDRWCQDALERGLAAFRTVGVRAGHGQIATASRDFGARGTTAGQTLRGPDGVLAGSQSALPPARPQRPASLREAHHRSSSTSWWRMCTGGARCTWKWQANFTSRLKTAPHGRIGLALPAGTTPSPAKMNKLVDQLAASKLRPAREFMRVPTGSRPQNPCCS